MLFVEEIVSCAVESLEFESDRDPMRRVDLLVEDVSSRVQCFKPGDVTNCNCSLSHIRDRRRDLHAHHPDRR